MLEYIFDLSDRKTRSHTISSALQEDGSIKVMSYSTDKNDPQSGVDNAWSENNLPVEYYNLQGLRVDSNNLTHGIYIKRQSGKTTKVIL